MILAKFSRNNGEGVAFAAKTASVRSLLDQKGEIRPFFRVCPAAIISIISRVTIPSGVQYCSQYAESCEGASAQWDASGHATN
jgi:hypothetical protein